MHCRLRSQEQLQEFLITLRSKHELIDDYELIPVFEDIQINLFPSIIKNEKKSLFMNIITSAHLAKYFIITETALKSAKLISQAGEDALALATQYVSDAHHFEQQGDLVRAFGALNYAHGILDCLAGIGLIEGTDSDLERWQK